MISEQTIRSGHSYSIDDAFDFCARITNAHYENFPVASLFLPKEKRPYIQAIYAFSRIADDFADESVRLPEERLANLQNWEEQLELCFRGEARHPVFIALSETVSRLDIPVEPFRDLLTAFRRDVTQHSYATFEDLMSYCSCSANPVGRLVLMIFGYRDEKLFRLSDHICTALQLTNFWQDVSVDKEKQRVYVPIEDMERFEYSMDDLQHGRSEKQFHNLMKFEVERTKNMFYDGAELPSLVENDLQLELRLVWFGGMRILKKIERSGFEVLLHRPTLNTLDKSTVFLLGLFYNNLSRFGRKRKQWDLT